MFEENHFSHASLLILWHWKKQEEKDANSKFEISVSDDFSGRWAFKSVARGYFLGASPDALICSAKTPGDAELWFVHLAARPQLNLFSIGRKRFAHLSDNQDEIRVDENVPWGEDTLFTLEFREEANKYAIHACNNMYLQKDGKLVPSVNKVFSIIEFLDFGIFHDFLADFLIIIW